MEYWIISSIGVLFIVLLIINICDLNRFSVTEYNFSNSLIHTPITFIVLSDLHNKSYGRDNKKLLDAIKAQKPNAVICAGDIMTATPNADFTPAVNLMKELGKEYPVYYGMGNHEYRARIYPKQYGTMYSDYMDELKKANITVLCNTSLYLEKQNINISGLEIDRKYYRRFTTFPMENDVIEQMVGTPKTSAYQLLIAHNPEYCKEYANWGADISICGHIHGGLIRIPFCGGIASPAVKFFPRYNGGIYHFGTKKAIVSRGLGTHTLPLRLFNPGELIVLKLSTQENS